MICNIPRTSAEQSKGKTESSDRSYSWGIRHIAYNQTKHYACLTRSILCRKHHWPRNIQRIWNQTYRHRKFLLQSSRSANLVPWRGRVRDREEVEERRLKKTVEIRGVWLTHWLQAKTWGPFASVTSSSCLGLSLVLRSIFLVL